VFISVFDHIRRYRDRGLPFERWLFVIARNTALKRREKASRAAVIDPAALAGEREREAARTAFHSESAVANFDALTATLSKSQRKVLLLLYGFAMSPADVASVLEQTPAAVRQTHSRALAKLGGRAPRLLGL
jgi:RNA polymerase sigma factor (sigma-70 family)